MNVHIVEDNQKHLQRFEYSPPHPSYIAGFIDGDGCIFIRKITDGYQSGISLTQCRTNILQIIRYHFGGSITSCRTRNNKIHNNINEDEYYDKYTTRNQYNLLIRSNEYSILFDYIQHNIVIKRGQLFCLKKFLNLVNLQNKSEEKEILYTKCTNYNKKIEYNDVIYDNINIEYIAGLFDAEGCFYININKFSKIYISLTQKNYPHVLVYIQKMLNIGVIDCEDKFKIYKKDDCLLFIRLIKDHLIVKYNQAEAFVTFLTTNDTIIKEQMYKICNQEKHQIELFTDLNQNEKGKEGYLETLRLKSIKENICKEIQNTDFYTKLRNKQFYKEKSEKMKGQGNHNYGKTFSTETRNKMSCSIRDAKGGVSDEIIMKVREMFQAGHKNVEIQKLLNLPNHTVTRIKNGGIVCRNEEKSEKMPLTQEQVNLSKRKIQTDEIIIVIEKYIKNWKPMQILDYLIERRNNYNIPNTVTIDIIKNIKRNLTNGKPVIYESELSKDNYDYYTSLINDFAKTKI